MGGGRVDLVVGRGLGGDLGGDCAIEEALLQVGVWVRGPVLVVDGLVWVVGGRQGRTEWWY